MKCSNGIFIWWSAPTAIGCSIQLPKRRTVTRFPTSRFAHAVCHGLSSSSITFSHPPRAVYHRPSRSSASHFLSHLRRFSAFLFSITNVPRHARTDLGKQSTAQPCTRPNQRHVIPTPHFFFLLVYLQIRKAPARGGLEILPTPATPKHSHPSCHFSIVLQPCYTVSGPGNPPSVVIEKSPSHFMPIAVQRSMESWDSIVNDTIPRARHAATAPTWFWRTALPNAHECYSSVRTPDPGPRHFLGESSWYVGHSGRDHVASFSITWQSYSRHGASNAARCITFVRSLVLLGRYVTSAVIQPIFLLIAARHIWRSWNRVGETTNTVNEGVEARTPGLSYLGWCKPPYSSRIVCRGSSPVSTYRWQRLRRRACEVVILMFLSMASAREVRDIDIWCARIKKRSCGKMQHASQCAGWKEERPSETCWGRILLAVSRTGKEASNRSKTSRLHCKRSNRRGKWKGRGKCNRTIKKQRTNEVATSFYKSQGVWGPGLANNTNVTNITNIKSLTTNMRTRRPG